MSKEYQAYIKMCEIWHDCKRSEFFKGVDIV